MLNSKQGKLIGEQKNDIILWVETMLKECNEYSKCIYKRDLSLVLETELYKITKKRLETIREDENAIFFNPFPIVSDPQHSIYVQFSVDFIQAIYNRLSEDGAIGDREVYFIYPSMDEEYYVLRDGKSRLREYIHFSELNDIIYYKMILNE